MDRTIPVSSKLVQQKVKERDDSILYHKLRRIQNRDNEYVPPPQGQVKKKPPQQLQVTKNNYLNDLRRMEVQRENNILAKKIKETENRSNSSTLKIPKLKNDSKEQTFVSQTNLNDPRKRELSKIAAENIHMMNRIESMRSVYGVHAFDRHNAKRLEVLELRCEYPVIIEKVMPAIKSDYKNRSTLTGSHHTQSKLSNALAYGSGRGQNDSVNNESSLGTHGQKKLFFGKPKPIPSNHASYNQQVPKTAPINTNDGSLSHKLDNVVERPSESARDEQKRDAVIFENLVNYRDKMYRGKIIKPYNE